MPAQTTDWSDITGALCCALILLVPLAGAGLALMNAGLIRSRNAAHAMLSAICVIAAAALMYFVCGWSLQAFAGRSAYTVTLNGTSWNYIGADPLFMRGLSFDGSRLALAAWLQMFSVGLTALIPLGAAGERWRLGAACASTALLAGLLYPLYAHWAWGGGWLAQLGFLDAGGSGVLQAMGGVSALSLAWILGPRQGKYDSDGLPTAYPGHNAVVVLFGCFLTWVGWIALNSAGSLLMNGGAIAGMARVAMNTTLSAASAVLASAAITRTRYGRADASLCANGWTGGLVASSAGCAWIGPGAAILVGAVSGILVVFAVEWLDARLHIDDPAGAVSVHAVGGIWGLLSVALFVGGESQWLAQGAGIVALLAMMFPLAYGLNRVLNRFYAQRVPADSEPHGLDLYELGAGAYPEFVTRREDFRPR